MTRDEAIGTQMRVYFNQGVPSGRAEAIATDQIDSWVALGILKLDEPKSAEDELREKLGRDIWSANAVLYAIDQIGLKVVRK